jgi:serine/threonine protein kinase
MNNDTYTCPLCGKDHRKTAKYCPTTGRLVSISHPPQRVPEAPPSVVAPQGHGLTGRLQPQAVIHNRFAIIQKIGEGGMAAVYQAADIRLPGQIWAVKEMSESWIPDQEDRVQAIQAFEQEAILLAKLNHPNLPRVIDSFSEDGRQYLVMEFVQGQTLEKLLDERAAPFTEREVLSWGLQLCDVLSYLHNQPQPIIFRDLKPSNIMIDQSGQIKLIDFGIVRFFKPGKTKDTMAIGTQGYCATEAISGQTDPRSDMYSLCVVLHEMLTLHDPTTTMFNLPPLCRLNPSVSAEWEKIIHRGLEQDRNRRWPDLKTLSEQLSRASDIGSETIKAVEPLGSTPGAFEKTIEVDSLPPIKSSRPTVRLVAVAAQLSSKQLAAAVGTVALGVIAGLWFLAPVLVDYPFIWNNIPIVAIVAPFVYAAVPRRWVASISHAILAFIGGSTIYLRLGTGNDYLVGLFFGVIISAAYIEIWLGFLNKIRGAKGQDAWIRELVWYCTMAVIAIVLLYELAFRGGVNPALWIWAVVMAALGWFLGDMVKEFIKMRQTGLSRKQ